MSFSLLALVALILGGILLQLVIFSLLALARRADAQMEEAWEKSPESVRRADHEAPVQPEQISKAARPGGRKRRGVASRSVPLRNGGKIVDQLSGRP